MEGEGSEWSGGRHQNVECLLFCAVNGYLGAIHVRSFTKGFCGFRYYLSVSLEGMAVCRLAFFFLR